MPEKIYVVKKGRKIGLFSTWQECYEQISNFSGAEYKKFSNLTDANNYLYNNEFSSLSNLSNSDINTMVKYDLTNDFTVIFIDGSYCNKTKKYSYGSYILFKDNNELKEYKHSNAYDNPKFLESRNVSGEIFGVIKSIEWAILHGKKKIKFYYDYLGIEKWFNGEWEAKTKISKFYKEFIDKNKGFFYEIAFQKVLAHSGIEYNEIADKLAKDALDIKYK